MGLIFTVFVYIQFTHGPMQLLRPANTHTMNVEQKLNIVYTSLKENLVHCGPYIKETVAVM